MSLQLSWREMEKENGERGRENGAQTTCDDDANKKMREEGWKEKEGDEGGEKIRESALYLFIYFTFSKKRLAKIVVY